MNVVRASEFSHSCSLTPLINVYRCLYVYVGLYVARQSVCELLCCVGSNAILPSLHLVLHATRNIMMF